MSYQVHNFQTGDVVEAGPVNEMDNQILLNSQDIVKKLDTDKVGVANGAASLNAHGKVPNSQLPPTVEVTDDNNGNVTLNFIEGSD